MKRPVGACLAGEIIFLPIFVDVTLTARNSFAILKRARFQPITVRGVVHLRH